MSNSEIRAKARQDLGGNIFSNNWMIALVVCLLVNILSSVCGSVVPLLGALLIDGPLMVGMAGYFLALSRKEPTAKIEKIFDGFNDFGSNFLLGLMMFLFTFLWMLLLIVPGIVKAYAYSMAFYIKRDHPTYNWKECLDESQRLMQGHKGDLFCLHLSFIGWALLCCLASFLTCGVGLICFLWLSPYVEAANANFYDSLVVAPAAPAAPVTDAPSDGPENTFESAE